MVCFLHLIHALRSAIGKRNGRITVFDAGREHEGAAAEFGRGVIHSDDSFSGGVWLNSTSPFRLQVARVNGVPERNSSLPFSFQMLPTRQAFLHGGDHDQNGDSRGSEAQRASRT